MIDIKIIDKYMVSQTLINIVDLGYAYITSVNKKGYNINICFDFISDALDKNALDNLLKYVKMDFCQLKIESTHTPFRSYISGSLEIYKPKYFIIKDDKLLLSKTAFRKQKIKRILE